MSNETTAKDTKRTMHDVEFPAVARQRSGFGEAWYRMDGDTLVGYQGDQQATGDNAWTMLKWDLDDDDATVVDGLEDEQLPTDFRNYATDGGDRDE